MEFTQAYAYLNRYKNNLTKQQYKTFLGQVKNGNIEGMIKGMSKLKKRGVI